MVVAVWTKVVLGGVGGAGGSSTFSCLSRCSGREGAAEGGSRTGLEGSGFGVRVLVYLRNSSQVLQRERADVRKGVSVALIDSGGKL